jgi:hypothetical protein
MTRKLLRLLLFALLLVCAVQLLAQTQIPVTGHISAAGANPSNPTLYQVQMQMIYCGANVPRVFGIGTISASTATYNADSTGLITGTIWPNDVITCGGVMGGTRYNVSFLTNGSRVGPTQCFQVLSTVGTFNFDTAQPCVTVPPPPPPPGFGDYEFNNLTLTGLLTGTNARFTGDVTALTFHFSTSGAHFTCPTGQFADALNQDFTFACAAPAVATPPTFNGHAPVTNNYVPTSGDYSFPMISGKLANTQTDSTLVYPGTFNKAQIWDHTPNVCPTVGGKQEVPTGTDNAGNATGCFVPVPAKTVVATANFTSCAMVSYGSTDQNCVDVGTWSNSISSAYSMSCIIGIPFTGGSADASGLSQTTFGLAGATPMTSTQFSYFIANQHGAAAGQTVTLSCAAFQ